MLHFLEKEMIPMLFVPPTISEDKKIRNSPPVPDFFLFQWKKL